MCILLGKNGVAGSICTQAGRLKGQIDLTAKSGDKTWTIPGIYKLTEVILVLCFGHWPTAIDPPDKELNGPPASRPRTSRQSCCYGCKNSSEPSE